MKKTIRSLFSLFVIASLILSMSIAAFAEGDNAATYKVSSATAKQGETVEVVVSVEADFEYACGYFDLEYDSNVLEYKDAEWVNSVTLTAEEEFGFDADDDKAGVVIISYENLINGDLDLAATVFTDNLVKLTFKVKPGAANGTYEVRVSLDDDDGKWFADVEYENMGIIPTCEKGIITVGSGSGSGDDAPTPTADYTVAMSADKTSAAIGDAVALSLDVSHESETEFSAFYGSLTYDSSKFSYSSAADASGFNVTDDGNGTLTITRTGGALTISDAHELTLRFEAKAAGEAEFALGSVKIDKLESAESDAAAATVSGSPITVTVVDTVVKATDYFNGYKLVKVTGSLAEGSTFYYGEEPMLKVSGEGYGANAYYFVVAAADYNEAKVSAKEGTSETLTKSADVNQTGLIDINDAQFVYNIHNGGPMPTINITARLLLADVNGDGKVDINDCAAVIAAIQ